VQHCARSLVPAVWHQHRRPRNARVRQMFDEAGAHGLMAGVTFSVIGQQGEKAIFSLCADRAGATEQNNALAQRGQGYMLLACLHESARRLGLPKSHRKSVALTKREKECLRWVAIGKTSWEISRILGVAESTVVFHVGNAGRKLETATRSQTVARALALGVIAL
jgi:LuxR family quorum-sensing transcriptional regulator LasR